MKEKLNNEEKFLIISTQWMRKMEAKKFMQILFMIAKTQWELPESKKILELLGEWMTMIIYKILCYLFSQAFPSDIYSTTKAFKARTSTKVK